MCVDLPLDKKTVENQDWATGPLGLRAAGPSRADGPSGRRAAGPSGVVGRGLLGRGPAFSKTRSRSAEMKVDLKIVKSTLFKGVLTD